MALAGNRLAAGTWIRTDPAGPGAPAGPSLLAAEQDECRGHESEHQQCQEDGEQWRCEDDQRHKRAKGNGTDHGGSEPRPVHDLAPTPAQIVYTGVGSWGVGYRTLQSICGRRERMLWLILGIILLVIAIAGGAIVHPILFVLAILALVMFVSGWRGRATV
jgi:hypothetical protein